MPGMTRINCPDVDSPLETVADLELPGQGRG
jgi:hypothetical protein